MSESKESKESKTSSSSSLTRASSEGASVRLEELGETASSGVLGETASSETQVAPPITIVTPATSSSERELSKPNLLQTILANKGITNITSDHIHVTIDGDDLVIHIKVPKEQSIGAPAAGGSLKKKRSLKSAKKAKTGPLSNK